MLYFVNLVRIKKAIQGGKGGLICSMESERFISMNSLYHSVITKVDGGDCWMKREVRARKEDPSFLDYYEDDKYYRTIQLTSTGITFEGMVISFVDIPIATCKKVEFRTTGRGDLTCAAIMGRRYKDRIDTTYGKRFNRLQN